MLNKNRDRSHSAVGALSWLTAVSSAVTVTLILWLISRISLPEPLFWAASFVVIGVLLLLVERRSSCSHNQQTFSDQHSAVENLTKNPKPAQNPQTSIADEESKRFTVHSSQRVVSMIAAANKVILRATSESELVHGFCNTIKDIGGYHHVWIGRPREMNKIQTYAAARGDENLAEMMNLTWDNSIIGNTPPGMTLKDQDTHIFLKGNDDKSLPDWTQKLPVEEMASCISIPLFSNDEFVGAVCLCSDKTNYFDTDEIDLLKNLVETLGFARAAILNTQSLKSETWKLQERLKEIHCISEALSWSADGQCSIDQFLQNLTDSLPQAFQWPDRTGARITLGENVFRSERFDEQALHSMSVWINHKIPEPCSLNISVHFDPDIDSHVSSGSKPFLPEEEKLLSDLSHIILRKIQSEISESEIRKSKELAEAILMLSQNSLHLSKEELFSKASDIAEKITDSEGAFIHSIDSENYEIELIGWSEKTLQKCPMPEKRHYAVDKAGIWAEAFRSKTPVIINDYTNLDDERKKGAPEGHFTMKRLISVPVLEGENVRLILGVANSALPYTHNETRRLMALGSLVWKILSVQVKHEEAVAAQRIFQETFEKTSVGIGIAGLDGEILQANPSFCKMLGYSQEELLGRNYNEFAHPEDAAKEAVLHDQLLKGEISSYHFNKRCRRNDGQLIWVSVDVNLNRDKEGNPKFCIGVAQDIDALVRYKDNLEESQKLLRLAHNIARTGAWKWSKDSNVVEWSPEALTLLGREASEMKNLHDDLQMFVHPDDLINVKKIKENALRSYTPFEITHRFFKPGEDSAPLEMRYLTSRGEPELDKQGNPTGYIGIIQDVTDQIKNQEFVVESQSQFKSVFNSVADAVYVTNLDGQILELNSEACRSHQITRERALEMNVTELDSSVRSQAIGEVLKDQWLFSSKNNQTIIYEGSHQREDGTTYPVEVRIRAITFRGEKALIGSARNLTEIRKRDELLHIQNEALEAAENAIFITDTSGKIIWVNESFSKVTGYFKEEVVGLCPSLLNSGQHGKHYFANMWKHILSGKVWRGELINKRKNGELFNAQLTIAPVMDDHGKITHFVAIQQDVSHLKQLEHQFQRSQRMETIGLLAGGIAHDLNNVLAPILMAAPILKETAGLTDEAEELIDTIEACVNRGSEIIRQILTFSRGVQGERSPINIKYILKDLVNMVRETFPKNISIHIDIENELSSIQADPTQLHQVFLNLAVNARDSLTLGGQITISAKNITIESAKQFLNMGIGPGSYVQVSIKDTGEGIPIEIQEQIFEPFYSTKEFGKGTGLGLPTVLGIVKSHGGLITVDSTPGEGSVFNVYFPASEEIPHPIIQPSPNTEVRSKDTVLIVDDEESIRKTVTFILQKSGMSTIEAPNGTEALKLYQAHQEDINIVITDRMMPEMDGETLAARLKDLNSSVWIIGMSGALDDSQMVSSQTEMDLNNLHIFDGYLLKPFSKEALLNAINESNQSSDSSIA